MKISKQFSGSYFKAADFDQPKVLTIESVVHAEFDDGPKPAIKFFGQKQELVLNKTNAMTLQQSFGDETDEWTGKQILVRKIPVNFQGRMVDGIRVEAVPEQDPPQPPLANPPQPMSPPPVPPQQEQPPRPSTPPPAPTVDYPQDPQ